MKTNAPRLKLAQIGLVASAGFQMGRTTCAWSADSLWTGFVPLGDSVDLVRCNIGAGGAFAIGIEVQMADKTILRVEDRQTIIERAWHRDDHEATYYVKGTSGSSINGVATGTTEGMLPSTRPVAPGSR